MSDHYTYRVTWSPDDQEHAGLCAEFPSLSSLAASPGEALDGIRKLVGEVLENMAATGERPPAPFADLEGDHTSAERATSSSLRDGTGGTSRCKNASSPSIQCRQWHNAGDWDAARGRMRA